MSKIKTTAALAVAALAALSMSACGNSKPETFTVSGDYAMVAETPDGPSA